MRPDPIDESVSMPVAAMFRSAAEVPLPFATTWPLRSLLLRSLSSALTLNARPIRCRSRWAMFASAAYSILSPSSKNDPVLGAVMRASATIESSRSPGR